MAKSNPLTGGVNVEDILALIDQDTVLLSVIYASNISGAILDIEQIVQEARKKKPNLFIMVDAVQHAPHGLIDIEKTPVDVINFAPYKFFGVRGCGIAYLSERAALLPHHKLKGKKETEWGLGTPTPAHYAAISAIVDYVSLAWRSFYNSECQTTVIRSRYGSYRKTRKVFIKNNARRDTQRKRAKRNQRSYRAS
nr:aminotransferase class V-fold PLP-dependent enzyme [Bacillus pumilus]